VLQRGGGGYKQDGGKGEVKSDGWGGQGAEKRKRTRQGDDIKSNRDQRCEEYRSLHIGTVSRASGSRKRGSQGGKKRFLPGVHPLAGSVNPGGRPASIEDHCWSPGGNGGQLPGRRLLSFA